MNREADRLALLAQLLTGSVGLAVIEEQVAWLRATERLAKRRRFNAGPRPPVSAARPPSAAKSGPSLEASTASRKGETP